MKPNQEIISELEKGSGENGHALGTFTKKQLLDELKARESKEKIQTLRSLILKQKEKAEESYKNILEAIESISTKNVEPSKIPDGSLLNCVNALNNPLDSVLETLNNL